MPRLCTVVAFVAVAECLRADDVIFRYEGNVLPYSTEGGWILGNPCEGGCSESLSNGYLVLRWEGATDFALYFHTIARFPDLPPPTLWVEWRFASNHPFINNYLCDASLVVDYKLIVDELLLFGDAVISSDGGDHLRDLALDEFRTFRFESIDGGEYCYWVDGWRFTCGTKSGGDGYHEIRFSGDGGCSLDLLPTVNRWDFVRYGMIGYGEAIVAVDPPGPATGGFLDARVHAPLVRFTVTYDLPNYVYVDEITVDVVSNGARSHEATKGMKSGIWGTSNQLNRQSGTAGETVPIITATRRQDNGPPETVEIVLNRPIPYNATTRFTLNDGTIEQTVELTFAPGDTDGDGDADLADFAALQNCFGESTVTGLCQSLDRDGDSMITAADFTLFVQSTP